MSVYHPPIAEHENVITAALHVIQSTHYARPENPHADAEAQHGQEQLALAARALAEAVDMLPADRQPIGWVRQPCPAALLPTGSAAPVPCTALGKHGTHQTADGRKWANAEVDA